VEPILATPSSVSALARMVSTSTPNWP